MQNDFSILIAARKNSKYLAKFLFGLFEYTDDLINVEVLVMMNKEDTWNKELVRYFEANEDVQFFYEDWGLGRGGLNKYFDELAKNAHGDWLIYFCEDHFINTPDWDKYFKSVIEERELDPNDIWILVPKFWNAGAMNHVMSRGFYKALGNMGSHGNIDSYINDVLRGLPTNLQKERIIQFDNETFHDFTHDSPSPMDAIHNYVKPSKEGLAQPTYAKVEHFIQRDSKKLKEAIEREKR